MKKRHNSKAPDLRSCLAAMATVLLFSPLAHGQASRTQPDIGPIREMPDGSGTYQTLHALNLALYRPWNGSPDKWISLDSPGDEAFLLSLAKAIPTTALQRQYEAVTIQLHAIEQEYLKTAAAAKSLLKQKEEAEKALRNLTSPTDCQSRMNACRDNYFKHVTPLNEKIRILIKEEQSLSREQLSLFNQLEITGHTPATF